MEEQTKQEVTTGIEEKTEIEENAKVGNNTENEDKTIREQFVRSPILLVGLWIAAIASIAILATGQTGKEVLFHSGYLVGAVLYTVFYFATRNRIPNEIHIVQKGKRLLFDIADCMFTVIIAMILAVFVLDCFKISVVDGSSMDTTLHDGQKLILGLHSYDFEEIKKDDIVVCYAPQLSEDIIKRVIGVPGDHVVISDNQLYLNGTLIQEDYIKEPMVTENIDVTVPEGKLFVMGDNRNNSGDSRWDAVGLIDIQKDLKGKIVFKSLFGIKK